jgi:hypothetical protein
LSRLYWRPTADGWLATDNGANDAPADAEVTEQHPLPVQVVWKEDGDDEYGLTEPNHGLPVNVTNAASVETDLYYVEFQLQTILAASAYSSADAVGSVFSVPVPKNGVIRNAKLIDPDDDTLALTVHLFTSPITGVADNAAGTFTAAEARGWVSSIVFTTTPLDIGGAKVMETTTMSSHYATPTGMLYGQCTTSGTPTIAIGAMPLIKLGIEPGRAMAN